MKWYVRCVKDNLRSVLPFQAQLRALKRRVVGYEPEYRQHPGVVGDALLQVAILREHFGTIEGRDLMEIGTGWEPIIPLIYRLAGARVVHLADVTKLISKDSLQAALDAVWKAKEKISSGLEIPAAQFDRILVAPKGDSIDADLRALGLIYQAPCDCRTMNLDSRSLDAVSSRAVFEHIPTVVIPGIFRETKRLLQPGGATCHIIDNSDHWEHYDKSITPVNFLQHGDLLWRFTCGSEFNYQNRLRHQDYAQMLRAEGFRIVQEQRKVHPPSLEALQKLKLAPQFRGREPEDLATIVSTFLAVPQAG
jgi:hypothetical protein